MTTSTPHIPAFTFDAVFPGSDPDLPVRILFDVLPGDPGVTFDLPENCYPATDPELENLTVIANPESSAPFDLAPILDLFEEHVWADLEALCWEHLDEIQTEAAFDTANPPGLDP